MAKTFVLVGSGSRGTFMFAKPLLEQYSSTSKLIGLFDSNLERTKAANLLLKTDLPTYDNFDVMMETLKPDGLIIASSDVTHSEYVVKGLLANKIVFSEKPLCIDENQVNAILKASVTSKGSLYVTHNMRYGNAMTKIKELLNEGKIGKLLSMEFSEMLDRNHGADYFRRWHGRKKNSGGLLIHKASHHFDILNWFANSKAKSLIAKGGTFFYGKNGPFRSQRCKGCPHSEKCQYYWDIEKHEVSHTLYQVPEKVDGYFRDGCLFAEDIDTEDFTSVSYEYENGVQTAYVLSAYASYEGMRIVLEGTEGRLEFNSVNRTSWVAGGNVVHGQEKEAGRSLQYIHPTKGVENIEVPIGEGGHGGADPALRDDFFKYYVSDQPTSDRMAGTDDAIQAVLVGVAANISMAKSSANIDVQSLINQ